ncbi:MAG: histidinol-phosphate transaminase [Myxococcales bacterium]|nr:histidinol-phosphate transaminase [Myxococcales bacterium]
MKQLVAPYIEALKPYVPGKPIEALRRERGIEGEILKLASNENPLGPSPMALAAVPAALKEAHFYPDGAQLALRARLAEKLGVGVERVVAGNGSNELIELIIRAFCVPGDTAIVSEYAFAIYGICMQTHGVEFTRVPMRDPLTHDLAAMAEAVTEETRLVWIANPNNPTGTYNARAELVAFLDRLGERGVSPLVIVDEAYFECVDAEDFPDSIALHDRYEGLITLRTFSKGYGLAAFRVGYAVTASEEVAGYLHRIRAPFNVGRVAQAVALAALEDTPYLERSLAQIVAGKAQLLKLLADIGVDAIPSQTNFLFCRTPRPAAEVFDAMLDHGVIVRPLGGFGLPDGLRITIGLPEQNVRVADVLRQVLGR